MVTIGFGFGFWVVLVNEGRREDGPFIEEMVKVSFVADLGLGGEKERC